MRCCACWALLIAVAAVNQWGAAHGAPACPLLDASGCCDSQCRVGLCAALYNFGYALGAHNTTGPLTWHDRQGWQELYSSGATSADAACSGLQDTARADRPFFCAWVGVSCNATLFANLSSCATLADSTGISRIEIVNNNLSGNLSSSAFMDSLQLLHDCGLRYLVLGGGYGELRGTMGPQWGDLRQLRGLSLFTTNLTGQLPDEIGQLTELQFLDLSANYIIGTLPSTLGNMASLRLLNLGKNGFTDMGQALGGPLPTSITQLRDLEVLSLESNELSGTLPANMCTDMLGLRAVSLRDNKFTGRITQFALCSLQSLDLSGNSFSGPLPVPLFRGPLAALNNRPPWLRLMSISLANNQLTGTLPEFPYGSAPLISVINVASNQLTGPFPRSWTFLPWMSQVDLSNNNFSGTLPYELAFQSMLTSLRLHSNPHISGTISPWFRLTVSLQIFTLHNTSVRGPLPGINRATYLSPGFDSARLCGGDRAGLGRLPTLQLATISDTNMSAQCEGGGSDCSDINQYLPWYLAAEPSLWDVPLPEAGFSDNAHMKCPRIIQEEFCRLYRPPEPFPATMRPSWSLSPSYYNYSGCQCMGGYSASYTTKPHGGLNISVLECSPSPSTLDPAAAAGVSLAASVVGLLLLGYCGYVSWYGRWGLPRLQRAVADLQKRREGAPTSGKVSIVVTDIERYSELMVKMPLSMGSAVSAHSNVIRRAAWSHYGFVVGQEGDSFILAFRDACDAVAFCLQVQQGLAKVHWPLELLQHQQQQDLAAAAPVMQQLLGAALQQPSGAVAAGPAELPHNPGMVASGGPGGDSGAPSVPLLSPASSSSLPLSAGAEGSPGQQSPSLLDVLLQRSNSSRLWNRQPQQQQQQGTNGGSAVSSAAGGQDPRAPISPVAAASPAADDAGVRAKCSSSQGLDAAAAAAGVPASSGNSAGGNSAWTWSRENSFLRPIPSGSAATSPAGLAAADSSTDGARPVSPMQQQQQLRQQHWLAPASVLVPGLRVRIGVASGVLGDKEDCLNCKVLDAARVVSDAGCGGQVLLDSVTFAIIKDRLEELGQVGSSGYVSSSRVTGWGTPKGWLARLARQRVQLAAEAVVLDMGLYSLPGAAVKPGTDGQALLPDLSAPTTAAAAATAAGDTGGAPPDKGAAAAVVPQAARTAAASTAGGQPGRTGAGRAEAAVTAGCVRLYQVLAPKCVARALLFGNSLALKRGARCHDLPYFSAPGAASRSLLDMLLVEGPRVGQGSRPSANWAGGSRVWLRHKYRLPVASAAAATRVLSVGQEPGRGSALPLQSPFSSGLLLSAPSAGKQQGGAALVPLSPPPMARAQSLGSLYTNKQPTSSRILEQRQQLDTSPLPSSSGANGTASAAAHAEGAAGSDSAHGSLQSTATSASAWPVVSIPLRGLTTLWSGSGPCSDSSTAGAPASVSGITFVFASATLPRSAKLLDGGHVAATVSAVVRQTLMAFAAAAAAADGCGTGGGGGGGSGAGGVAGYLFRESRAEMKYLLAFRSPKAALEWCLLAQEALLWQDWPAAVSAGTRTADPSSARPPAAAPPTAATHAAAGGNAVVSPPAAAAAAAAAAVEAANGHEAADAADLAGVGVSPQLVLSGPRLKMGVAAGTPQSVTPDHLGRADYHGHAVNMAARYEAVCAQPGQIVCDVSLAESVMAEWAAAAAEAAAVQQELQHISAGMQDAAAAAAVPAAGLDARDTALLPPQTVGVEALAALQQQQQQQQQQQLFRQTSSPFALAAQQELLAEQQQLLQQWEQEQRQRQRSVSNSPAADAGGGGSSGTGDSSSAGMPLWQEPSLSSSVSGVVQAASAGAPSAGAAAAHAGPEGDAEFASFALACPAPSQQRGSVTFPFAGMSQGQAPDPAAAAAAAAQPSPAAAAAVGAQQASGPKRVRSIPHRSPVRPCSNRSVAGSAPTAAAPVGSLTAGNTSPGRLSLESTPSNAAWGTPPQRRTSTPGAFMDAVSLASGGSGLTAAGGVAAAAHGRSATPSAAVAAGAAGSFACPGVAGLGGGFGFYGGGSSRRAPVSSRHSLTLPYDHQQQQQQQQQRSGRSGYLKGAGSGSAAAGAAAAPPQLLPLQPPMALPCPAAVPEGVPAFQVSVETHRLGRYTFKGAATPIAMVEVVVTHLLPRRQHLQDPAQLPRGPKGGLAEAEQGLVDAVHGVRLPGLAHVYRQAYRERSSSAAAVAAAAAAAAAAPHGRGGGGVFGVHRFLRPSLQAAQQDSAAAVASGGSGHHVPLKGPGSAANSGSLSASSQPVGVGRLSSLLGRSFSLGASSASSGGRRLSAASVSSAKSVAEE